jgi:pimeloyl-ACP methyl ester carboxylesterase
VLAARGGAPERRQEPAVPEHGVIDVRGTEVEYLESGEGPTVLFLHGARGISAAPGEWIPMLEDLARDFRVIVPSHPDFGGTAKPYLCESMADLAFHYLDLLDALSEESVSLVGHSFGGWLAAEIAVRERGRVDRLALINPMGLWVDSERIPDMFIMDPAEVIELATISAGDGGPTAPVDIADREQWYADWAAFARYSWSPPFHDPALRDRLHRVRVPTLVIASGQDRVTSPAYAQQMSELIPGAVLETFAVAGHALPIEQPVQLAETVKRFLAGPA